MAHGQGGVRKTRAAVADPNWRSGLVRRHAPSRLYASLRHSTRSSSSASMPRVACPASTYFRKAEAKGGLGSQAGLPRSDHRAQDLPVMVGRQVANHVRRHSAITSRSRAAASRRYLAVESERFFAHRQWASSSPTQIGIDGSEVKKCDRDQMRDHASWMSRFSGTLPRKVFRSDSLSELACWVRQS